MHRSAAQYHWPANAIALVVALTGLMAGMLTIPATGAVSSPDPILRERLRDAMQDTASFPDEFEAQVWLTDMAIRLGNQVADSKGLSGPCGAYDQCFCHFSLPWLS